MSAKVDLTPWSRHALDVAAVNRFVLSGRIPQGWQLHGYAASPTGPFHFDAIELETAERRTFTAHRFSDVSATVEHALAWMGADDLESTLAASLAARGETA